MRILNSIAPETAALIRARIAGKPMPKAIAKAPKRKTIKSLVSQFHAYDPRRDAHTIQLPIHFESYEYNSAWHDVYIDKNGNPRSKRADAADKKKKMVGNALAQYLPRWLDDESERARLKHIEFVRIGMKRMDDDNIWIAFKAIRDRTCSFALAGRESFAKSYERKIGQADDILQKRGLTWTYRQMQCESNPRLYGIRLILHCAPRAEQP